jgi:hypothetical protein
VSRVLARVVAAVLAVTIAGVLAAALAREAVVAKGGVLWSRPKAWDWLLVHPGTLRAGVAGAVAVALVIVFLMLAVRAIAPARRVDAPVPIGEGDRQATIRSGAIDALVTGAVQARVPELRHVRVRVRRRDAGLIAEAVCDVPRCDLGAVHARAYSGAVDALHDATGLGLQRLDLEIRRFVMDERRR